MLLETCIDIEWGLHGRYVNPEEANSINDALMLEWKSHVSCIYVLSSLHWYLVCFACELLEDCIDIEYMLHGRYMNPAEDVVSFH